MRRRQQARVLGVLAALLLVAVIGVGAWYFLVYTRSPQYALNQFFAVAKANDSERVGRFTDPSGTIIGLFTTASTVMGNRFFDPVSLVFPGYKNADIGQTQSYEIKNIKVEGETARAQVTLKVTTPNGEVTMNPTYVLRKVENQWKVAIEPTLAGSFNEFVPNAVRQQMIRQIRRVAGNPMAQSMIAPQLNSMRSEIEKYPQLFDFLRRAGLM
ncbi:MAG: hypothetical protein C4337_02630 [Armatimonadota bacterium]